MQTVAVLPGVVARAVERYLAALEEVAPGQVEAVYAVGSLALADFSSRQSNLDLVVVSDAPLDSEQARRLGTEVRQLRRAGRSAQVWYTTWEEVAGGPPALRRPAPLATPMTWAILRRDPMALVGPDWPVAWHDEEAERAWFASRLRELVTGRLGLLVLRRAVVPMVLEASRLALGVRSGRVLSKSEAGEVVQSEVSPKYRRILTDAVGYRKGAQTSMYWGPFERKYDALSLLEDLLELAESVTNP
jgi:hypothetical protein